MNTRIKAFHKNKNEEEVKLNLNFNYDITPSIK